jgi:hypothetical protein
MLVAVGLLNAAEHFQPTFASDVTAPEKNVVLPFLKAACGEGVRAVTAQAQNAFGCGDGSMGQADGVIFGHFLSPTSEDAAIDCSG